MFNLNTNLNSVGISAAKGIDLVVKRDELGATLPRADASRGDSSGAAASTKKTQVAAQELNAEQQRQVRELEQIDRKVRAHERAHISAGGELITSGPSYSYTYGPDGKQYATAGEVGIDTSAERKPEANIDKGQLIRVAALAPADPSPQDYQVASVGSRLESQGRSDLVRQQREERVAQEQAAQQQRPSQIAAGAPADSASKSALAEGGRNSRDARQLVQNAYVRAADGSVNAGQVSVFA